MDQILTVAGSVSYVTGGSPGSGQGFQVASPAPSEKFTVDHLSQGRYGQYCIDTRYINTTGLDVLPVGKEGLPGVVVQRQIPTSEKHLYWTVERDNAMPDLPALTTSDPNEIPISQELLLCNVLQGPLGHEIWRASGVNKYKLKVAKTASSLYPIGSTPAELAPATTRYYAPVNFKTTIIDASAGAPAVNLQQVIQALQ